MESGPARQGTHMIFDQLSNAHLYAALGRPIETALEYLKRTDLAGLSPGRHEIEGVGIYASVSEYTTKLPDAGRWEAHRRYIDLQYVVHGTERIGHAPVDMLRAEPYDEEKDVMWLSGDGQFVTLVPGDFMLLFPTDAHMPGMAVDAPVAVKKVVVKIAVAVV